MPLLLAKLAHPHSWMQWPAYQALSAIVEPCQLGAEETTRRLDLEPALAVPAFAALERMGLGARDGLLALTRIASTPGAHWRRGAALRALGRVGTGDPRALECLEAVLREATDALWQERHGAGDGCPGRWVGDGMLQRVAVEAMMTIGGGSVERVSGVLLEHPSPRVGRRAARWLRDLGPGARDGLAAIVRRVRRLEAPGAWTEALLLCDCSYDVFYELLACSDTMRRLGGTAGGSDAPRALLAAAQVGATISVPPGSEVDRKRTTLVAACLLALAEVGAPDGSGEWLNAHASDQLARAASRAGDARVLIGVIRCLPTCDARPEAVRRLLDVLDAPSWPAHPESAFDLTGSYGDNDVVAPRRLFTTTSHLEAIRALRRIGPDAGAAAPRLEELAAQLDVPVRVPEMSTCGGATRSLDVSLAGEARRALVEIRDR